MLTIATCRIRMRNIIFFFCNARVLYRDCNKTCLYWLMISFFFYLTMLSNLIVGRTMKITENVELDNVKVGEIYLDLYRSYENFTHFLCQLKMILYRALFGNLTCHILFIKFIYVCDVIMTYVMEKHSTIGSVQSIWFPCKNNEHITN